MSLPKFKGIPKGIAWLSMVGVLSLMFAAPAVVTAAPATAGDKVWVCKVVGGPGHYSLSKEGKQPIEVSVSALGSDVNPVIGAPFNDAQPSFVVASDDPALCEAGLPPVVATPVTPTAPTSVDKCGTKDDTYTVPSTNGVDYLVGNEVVAAGTHPGTGSVTVVAKAKSGFMLDGTSTWTFGFTNVACEQPNPLATIDTACSTQIGSGAVQYEVSVNYDGAEPFGYVVVREYNNGYTATDTVTATDTDSGLLFGAYGDTQAEFGQTDSASRVMIIAKGQDGNILGTKMVDRAECGGRPVPDTKVTPTAPTSVDKCGTKDDTYTVPSTNGVDYLVGNEVVAAGTHPGTGSVTVVAKAKSGFMLDGTSTWTFGFTNVACEQPPVVVINPSGKVTVDCKGSGTATFDNSKSMTQVGFELVVNGNATLYSVSAGAVKQQSFSGAKSGSTVILQDGEANFIASAKVPKCAVVVPPTKKPATSPTPKSAPAATSVNSEKSTATVAQVATVPVGAPQTGDGSTANQSNNGLLPSLGILGFLLAFAAAGTAWAIRRRQRV